MMVKCDDSYINQVVSYIGDDKLQCFYLYADMLEFGTQGDRFGLWIFDYGNGIDGAAYRYYDTIHLYSRGISPKAEMLELIEELKPLCITGPQDLIAQIKAELNGSFTEEIMCVRTIEHLLERTPELPFTEAGVEDVPDIAAIMMEEKIYSSVYSYESLCRQMQDGIRNGKRRSYILRNRKGLMLASCGIYVETENEAAIGGLIVNKRVHGLGFGPAISSYVWNLVLKEGKRGVAFINIENKDPIAISNKQGYKDLGTYARLVRNLK